MEGVLILLITSLLILIIVFAFIAILYKKCPPNKIIVVYGKTGRERTAKCVHGGGTFILPLIQDYTLLSLEPLTTDIDLKDTVSKDNINADLPSNFIFGISTDEKIMINAAERLLGLDKNDIIVIAKNIIKKELSAISKEINSVDCSEQKRSEIYFKRINEKLNEVGLQLFDIKKKGEN